ncbi:hypothetical protein EV127DRAFT_404274 [Xylaria flabelliformis]|nr:hypothetical protein EV127DRAFT_404274 [Xylaria flabelliformis]
MIEPGLRTYSQYMDNGGGGELVHYAFIRTKSGHVYSSHNTATCLSMVIMCACFAVTSNFIVSRVTELAAKHGSMQLVIGVADIWVCDYAKEVNHGTLQMQ